MRRVARISAVVLILGVSATAQSPLWPPVLIPSAADPAAPTASATLIPGKNMTVNAVAVDASDNIYVAGSGSTTGIPGLDRGFDSTPDGVDAFVAKLDRNGLVLWATYLGGSDPVIFGNRVTVTLPDSARAIAVDASGQVYIAGVTGASNFPVTNGFKSSSLGETDGFVAKLSADGRRVLYASYIGAAGESMSAGGIAVGVAGDVWVDLLSPRQRYMATHTLWSQGARVVLKLNSSGMPVWSTRVSPTTEGGFAVDGSGRAHLAGATCGIPRDCQQVLLRLDPSGTMIQHIVSFRSPYADLHRSSVALLPDGRAVFSGVAYEPPPGSSPPPCPSHLFRDCGRAFVAIAADSGNLEFIFPGFFATAPLLAADALGRVSLAVGTTDNSLPLVRPLLDHHVDGPIYVSHDRGITFRIYGRDTMPSAGIDDLVFNPRRNTVYAITEPDNMVTNGLFESQDEAAAWRLDTQCGVGIATCYRVAVDPRQPTVRYGIFSDHVFRHDEGASQWRQVFLSPRGIYQRTVVVSPFDSSVWIAGNAGVTMSQDGGATWIDRSAGLPNLRGSSPTVQQLDFDPRRPGVVYAMTQAGLYRFTQAGLQQITGVVPPWEHLTGAFSPAPNAVAIAFDPIDNNRIHLATLNYGVLTSADAGRTWTRSLEGHRITVVRTDHMKRHIVYAGGSDPEGRPVFYLSIDHGATWHRAAAGLHARSEPSRLVVDPRDSLTLYLGSSNHEAVPYIQRLQLNPAHLLSPVPEFATYLGHGSISAMAATVSGGLVAAINHAWPMSAVIEQQIVTVRIAP